MGVVPAGMHAAVVLGAESLLVGKMIGAVRFLHRDAVNVKAQRKRRAGTPGIKHAHAPRIPFGCLEEFLGNAA